MSTCLRLLVLVILLTLVPRAGYAQSSANEPLPSAREGAGVALPEAVSLKLLYRFSGIRDGNAGPWTIASAVMCSNRSKSPIKVRLLLWGLSGINYVNTTYLIPALNTHTAVTRAISTYPASLDLGLGAISQGMGEIKASSNKLYCSVQVMDALNSPPTFATTVHMERFNL